jgi:hypothetical protein
MVEEEAEGAVARVVAERTRMGTAAAAKKARVAARVAAVEAAEEAAEAAAVEAETAQWAAAWAAVAEREEMAAAARTASIANLDILHRQQMIGEWSRDINAALINEQTKKAVEPVTKQEVKKHMGSMLGDWDKAGKLSKRRIRKTKTKTKTKTKRRRQKITKRRRK